MTTTDLALLPPRAALGATMLYHGLEKLRGEGPERHAQMFEGLGFEPGHVWAMVTGAAEVFAGATVILGIGTRLGALAALGTQAVAVAKVHAPKGFSNMDGGYEFNLSLMAIALGLVLSGPGGASAHHLVEERLEPRRSCWGLGRRSSRPSATLRALDLVA